uniref:Uncharacterized protein n=1 Tax=Monodon monoceros TaxID=40151 RepID=A0A8C6ALT0_MONMO
MVAGTSVAPLRAREDTKAPPSGIGWPRWNPSSSTFWLCNLHNHEPLALLRQAQEGEEADQQLQEQQENVGQPPGEGTGTRQRVTAPARSPGSACTRDLPEAQSPGHSQAHL